MKKQNHYLATGALLCSTALGILAPIQNTYADTLTPEEEAVIEVTDGISAVIQPIIDNAELPDGYTLTIKNFNTAGSGMVLDDTNSNSAPVYKPSSVNAAIKLNKSDVNDVELSRPEIANSSDPAIVQSVISSIGESIIEYLKDNGFEEYPYSNMFTQEYINHDTNIICLTGYDTAFSCGHTSWWSMNENWTNLVNSIGAAYYQKQGSYPILGYPGYLYEKEDSSPKVYDSTYEPYQYTFVGVSNAMGLFYRKSPTSDWTYFTATQAALNCNDFEGETEKGFGGMVCYDAETQELSTVGAIKEESPKSPDTGSSTSEGNGNIATISTAIMTGFIVSLGSFFYLFKRQKQSKR